MTIWSQVFLRMVWLLYFAASEASWRNTWELFNISRAEFTIEEIHVLKEDMAILTYHGKAYDASGNHLATARLAYLDYAYPQKKQK